jgi:quinolinate synthase
MTQSQLEEEIIRLKKDLDVTVVGHFYQKDEVYKLADITGDSLELAKKSKEAKTEFIVFCGVGFMGQSVKILDESKRVLMPKIACCSMAKMIDGNYFDASIKILNEAGISSENILPITYINSDAQIKAKVGQMGGLVCTSSNAKMIIEKALEENKKILFVPDRCLGQNIANSMNLKSCVIGDGKDPKEADIICYDGFCSVHQLFDVDDIKFYKEKYLNIQVVVHPECDPKICNEADFVGSTSQIKNYVESMDKNTPVVVGTEFNFVNRLEHPNAFVLSSTKPECPTMNETTLEDLYNVLKSIEDNKPINEIFVDQDVIKWSKVALERMFQL